MSNKLTPSISFRVFADLALLASLFLLPWWMTGFFSCVLLLFFPRFYEFVIAGIGLSVLYYELPAHEVAFYLVPLCFIVVYFTGEMFKHRLVFYI